MKTKYDKIAKHIRRLNELLGVADNVYREGNTVTIALMKALKQAERDTLDYVFTSSGVDAAVEAFTLRDF